MINPSGVKVNKMSEEQVTLLKLPFRYTLLAKKLVIKGENRRELLDLMSRFLKENDPQTEIENILCEKIIISLWKLQRARVIEKNLLDSKNKILDDSLNWDPDKEDSRKRIRNIKKVRLNDPEIQYVIQYQSDLEKSVQRGLTKLKEEQSTRGSVQNYGK